jgi:probable HAF family extracellular repeat protein
MRRLLWGLAALALLACPLSSRADYLVTDLGAFTATGLNNAGQVVGNAGGQAVLYSGGSLTNLGGFFATSINNAGQVAGTVSTASDIRAVVYSGGVTKDLGSLGWDVLSSVKGMNDAGQVVGAAGGHAFLYSGGVFKDLGTLGGPVSRAYGINASGQVVGYAYTAGNAQHAFLYSGGKMIDLGGFFATSINNAGQVTGFGVTPAGPMHAFLYSSGKMTDLGTLGSASSFAWAINASGQVVGDNGFHALLFSGGKITDLNSLLPANARNGVASAVAINDRGQIVVNSMELNGHAYLLTPDSVAAAPEPGSLTLLAVGAAGLLGWRRWRPASPRPRR